MDNNFHPPLPRDDATTVKKAIQKIRFDNLENLYVFKKGTQIRRFRGTSNRVTPAVEYFFEMKNSTLVHNHTSGSSFSLEDIKNAVYHDISEFFLVTHNFLFYLKRPVDGWMIDFDSLDIQELWNSCKYIVGNELDKLVAKNELTLLERDKELFDYIWSLFFAYFEIEYRKIPL